MKVTMIVSNEKNGKRFGYAFNTKRKNKQSLLGDINKVCYEEKLKLNNVCFR